ncbi:MAG: hypothetical protein K2G24_03010 [Muribaculaceae bacterium]|nr:hypothetical protein [Muribaculaceae bacterium]
MKKQIKVAILTVRTVTVEPSAVVSVDNDIPPQYGTVKCVNTVYFSDNLEADKDVACRALAPITGSVSHDRIKIAPDEPWVDTTPRRQRFDAALTAYAVRLLSEALPDYEFAAVDCNEEVQAIIEKERKTSRADQKHSCSFLTSISTFFKRLADKNTGK